MLLTGLISAGNISFILVFMEGLLSFFSPCVIPLIPIYMSYLAGNAKATSEDGIITYERKKVSFHTVFFILGISAAFFILGMSFSAIGNFFKEYQLLFTRIGGILIVFLGLIQVGFLDLKFFQKEHKIHINIGSRKMSPVMAFLMGFTFSFAWTPCIGPALSSVLILASGSKDSLAGYLLVLVYLAGFVIPFLLLGLFTAQVLIFLKKHQRLLKYTVKTGGIILIVIGVMTFTGWMNGFSSYLNRFVPKQSQENNNTSVNDGFTLATPTPEAAISPSPVPSNTPSGIPSATSSVAPSGIPSVTPSVAPSGTPDSTGSNDGASKDKQPAYDFTLTDQYGNEHTLSDYKGKVVFLNFWATWCPPCKGEIPDIEALYKEYGKNEGDVIFLGVANPISDAYPNNADATKDEVVKFLEDYNYTFPVVFDETGDVLKNYYISAFPTTFMIDKDGNIYGYAPGALTKDIMINIIDQTLKSTE